MKLCLIFEEMQKPSPSTQITNKFNQNNLAKYSGSIGSEVCIPEPLNANTNLKRNKDPFPSSDDKDKNYQVLIV